MFRKIILSSVLAAGAIAGLTFTPASADAHERPVRIEHRHFTRFEVCVRHGGCWDVWQTFGSRFEAQREADHLRHRGSIVEIRPCW